MAYWLPEFCVVTVPSVLKYECVCIFVFQSSLVQLGVSSKPTAYCSFLFFHSSVSMYMHAAVPGIISTSLFSRYVWTFVKCIPNLDFNKCGVVVVLMIGFS